MKKTILTITAFILLIISSGCGGKDVNGIWEINLDLQVYNKKLSSEPVRVESLPLNVILQKEGDIVYLLPAPYLTGGMTGKGYIKDGILNFNSSLFQEFLFIEKLPVKTLDLSFKCSGDISPEKDYIFGDVKGTLTIVTPEDENLSCDIEEGTFVMRKKGEIN